MDTQLLEEETLNSILNHTRKEVLEDRVEQEVQEQKRKGEELWL